MGTSADEWYKIYVTGVYADKISGEANTAVNDVYSYRVHTNALIGISYPAIECQADFLPDSTTRNLGASSYPWEKLYMSSTGSISMNGYNLYVLGGFLYFDGDLVSTGGSPF